MNVIQFSIEETTGKILDKVTHSTGGPGGCILITTHEQYREVRKYKGSGEVTPNISLGYQTNNAPKTEKRKEPETTKSLTLSNKVSAIREEERSVYTSTEQLDTHCRQQTRSTVKQMKPNAKPKLSQKKRINRRTQATQTESMRAPETEAPKKSETKVPQKSETKIPQKSKTEVPEKSEKKVPQKSKTKVPEKSKTKVPEKSKPKKRKKKEE